jgi:hypothetical protein
VQRRIEETVVAGDPQGGSRPVPVPHQRQCTGKQRRTPRGGRGSCNPLETGPRRRTDAEKQRAAKGKAARADALTRQDWERQQRVGADRQDLAECLMSGMGLLTLEQVERIANAVQGTTRGPMEALRGLSAHLVALAEENP